MEDAKRKRKDCQSNQLLVVNFLSLLLLFLWGGGQLKTMDSNQQSDFPCHQMRMESWFMGFVC